MRRAAEERAWISQGEEGSIHLLVSLQLCVSGCAHPNEIKIRRCDVQWGYFGYVLTALLLDL